MENWDRKFKMNTKYDIKKLQKRTFKENMSRLTEITVQLEGGNCELEDIINLHEEGSILMQICQQKLNSAKLRIEEVNKSDYLGINLKVEQNSDLLNQSLEE